MSYTIRPFSPADREAVRNICCETGFSGDPVDPLFCDRDVFADFLTRYYTDWEPESALVVEHEGKIIGYLIGCLRFRYNAIVQPFILMTIVAPKVFWRLISGHYDKQSSTFLKWCCFQGSKETPSKPKKAGHFHFNLLPEHRNSGQGRRLMLKFCDMARNKGIPRVYGQIQTRDDRRTERAFNRHGFFIFDRKEISKFRDFHNKKIYVSTVVKEIDFYENQINQ